MDRFVSNVVLRLDSKGRVYHQEQAVRVTLFALPFGSLLGVWLLVPGLRQLARAAYDKFAVNRLRVSSAVGLGACGVPQPTAAIEASTKRLLIARCQARPLCGLLAFSAAALSLLALWLRALT